jgi:hypothetical protein
LVENFFFVALSLSLHDQDLSVDITDCNDLLFLRCVVLCVHFIIQTQNKKKSTRKNNKNYLIFFCFVKIKFLIKLNIHTYTRDLFGNSIHVHPSLQEPQRKQMVDHKIFFVLVD